MTDRVKESLFASLGPLEGAHVLDLYAGSGALAIEALSRGAARALLVERDTAAVATIGRNLAAAGFGDRAEVRRGDVRALLRSPPPDQPFTLVFVDPPYGAPATEVAEVLGLLVRAWVAKGSTLVLRRRAGGESPSSPPGLRYARRKRYGDTLVLVATVDEGT